MKTLNDKSLKAFIGMIAFAAVLLLAQQRASAQAAVSTLTDKDITVTEFNSINVADNFDVTLSRGSYGVRLTVDKDLAPYVEAFVRSKTLFLSYDEKSVPKDIKKQYKGKSGLNAVFRVVVYMPEIQSITLGDNAILSGVDEFSSSLFELTAAGKAMVKSLNVNASSAKINLKKNTLVALNLRADRGVEVNTDNNANLKMTLNADELAMNADGSSVINISGSVRMMNFNTAGSAQVTVSSDSADNVELTTEGSSKVSLTGSARSLTIKGSRNSAVDAFAMPVDQVDANLSNSATATVTVYRLVSASLVGGSSLYFSGSPEFRIGKIMKSTLAPFGSK